MAKPSRSKQPAFDPSELEDLIHTPAVGTGVGSHLVQTSDERRIDPPGLHSAKQILEQLERGDQSTVVKPYLTTIVRSDSTETPITQSDQSLLENTGPESDKATVVVSKPPPLSVAIPETPILEQQQFPIWPVSIELWVTESGEVVPQSRVKRIRLAQDVLNSAEESVYDTLWNVKGAVRTEGDTYRFTQAGYDYLMKKTRLSKKTVQRIIDRLIAKDFINIEQPADIYRRTATTYRVFSYRTVLDRQAAKRRFHAVKIGPGFLFARKVDDTGRAFQNMTTVATSNSSTAASETTPTVVRNNLTTVVPETTRTIDKVNVDISSSDILALRSALGNTLGIIDDEAIRKLFIQCRSRAGDCTIEEIAYIVSQKLRFVRNIQNPVGFMLKAVPAHFENDGHLPIREILRQQAEERLQQWQQTYQFWTKIAEDPAQPEEERNQARGILESLRNCQP